MKLTHFIVISALLHGLFIAVAYTRPIEIPEAQIQGWQEVELKPITLQVLTPTPIAKLPIPEPIEAPEPELEPEEVVPEPKPELKPEPKVRPRASRPELAEPKPLELSESPIKPEAPKPAAAAKKLVTVVTTQDDDVKQVAQEASPEAPLQEAAGAIAANHLKVQPLAATVAADVAGRVEGRRDGVAQGSRASAYKGGTDDDGSILRGYKKAVFVAVNRQKSYPTLARRMKLEGKVFVELELDAEGKILSARIKRSSGHEVLDKEALKSLLALGKLPSPPPQIAGAARRLTIPLIYRLT